MKQKNTPITTQSDFYTSSDNRHDEPSVEYTQAHIDYLLGTLPEGEPIPDFNAKVDCTDPDVLAALLKNGPL